MDKHYLIANCQKMRHINIPIFIPELACPFQCIFCNQQKISGQEKLPTEDEILETIKVHLATAPPDTIIEIAFFGGSFTGLSLAEQERLLKIPQEFIKTILSNNSFSFSVSYDAVDLGELSEEEKQKLKKLSAK